MFRRRVVGGLLVVLLSACGAGETLRHRPAGVVDETAPILAAAPDARTSAALIGFMQALNALPADRHGDALDASIRDFMHARSSTSTLALALTLQVIAPDEEQARTLRAWLATQPAIPAAMDALLRERLEHSEHERRAVRAATARARELERRQTALAAQARDAHADAASLRAALTRAEAKIRALTSIEEEIGRSGSNAPEPP